MSTVVIPVRCSAHKANGQQCSNTTKRGTMCWVHLRAQKGLRIKTSDIPDAGLGLFTTKERRRGEDLANYTGDVVVSHDEQYGGDYALQIKKNPPTFIDAKRSNTGEGRYANASRVRGKRNNAQLILDQRNRVGKVRATVKIPAGKEITVAYGARYWHGRGVQ